MDRLKACTRAVAIGMIAVDAAVVGTVVKGHVQATTAGDPKTRVGAVVQLPVVFEVRAGGECFVADVACSER